MEYAHGRGVVHRDLKPANVLLQPAEDVRRSGGSLPCDGTGAVPKITDFGLARQLDSDARLTQSGCVVGTPQYMAPEQVLGHVHRLGPLTDVYALGGILYKLLSGRPEFRGETSAEVLKKVADLDPPPPSRLHPGVPRDLDTVCLKCLAKDTHGRYASAEALADDLDRFLRGLPLKARPAGTAERLWRWAKWRPAEAALSALVLLVAAGGFAGVVAQWRVAVANERRAEEHRGAAERQWGDAERARDSAAKAGEEAVRQRDNVRRNLHQALLREAEATRRARQPGYRDRVWDLLRQAVALDVPGTDRAAIRREAAASLGDFLGRTPLHMTGFPSQPLHFAFDPRGTHLAIGLGDGTVSVRNLATGREEQRLAPAEPAAGPICPAYTGPAELVAAHAKGVTTWSRDGEAQWQRTETLALGQPASLVEMTADARHVVGGQGTRVTLWDRTARRVLGRFDAPAAVSRVSVSPGGKWVAAAYTVPAAEGRGEGTPTVRVWDAATGESLPPLAPGLHYVFDLPFSSDAATLACVCIEGVAVYRLPGLEQVDAVRGVMPHGGDFSPDGSVLAVPSLQEDVVRLWPFGTGLERTALPHPGLPRRVAFSPDGRRVVTASERTVRVWNLAGTPEKRVLFGHSGGVPGVEFSPDGKSLASAGKDGAVRLWDVETGEPRGVLARFTGEGQAVAWSPDGAWLATGDYTAGLAQIWDVASGRERARVSEGIANRVQSVGFSPDGGLFAVGSAQGLRVFHVDRPAAPDGQLALRRFEKGPPETSTVGRLRFAPRGRLLAWANNHQGVVHSWDLEAGRVQLTSVGPVANRIESLGFFPDGERIVFLNRRRDAEVWGVRGKRKVASFPAAGPGEGESGTYAAHIGLIPSPVDR